MDIREKMESRSICYGAAERSCKCLTLRYVNFYNTIQYNTKFVKRHVAVASEACILNESVPIQLAQCRFPGLVIFTAEIFICFSNKIYGSNFIKQRSETVMALNSQNVDCTLRKKYCVIYYNFRQTFVPYVT